MIVNIRGTSGSGKSTLVRELMSYMRNVKTVTGRQLVYPDGKERVLGYTGVLPSGRVSVVGSYATPCGGCDAIKTQDEVCARVNHFSTRGSVVFEGLLISHIYGRYKELAYSFNHLGEQNAPGMNAVLSPERQRPAVRQFWFAFLDTPLDECLARVEGRRAARGNSKPFDPTNTRQKWHDARRVYAKAQADGLSPVWLNWYDPLPALLRLLQYPNPTVDRHGYVQL